MDILFVRLKTFPVVESLNCKLDLLTDAVEKSRPDLVVAPEYFLTQGEEGFMLTTNEQGHVLDRLKELSKNSGALIIPGTMPQHYSLTLKDGTLVSNQYRNFCPVIATGEVIKEVPKVCVRGIDKSYNSFFMPFDMVVCSDDYLSEHTFVHNGLTYVVNICDDDFFVYANDKKPKKLWVNSQLPIPQIADVEICIARGNNSSIEEVGIINSDIKTYNAKSKKLGERIERCFVKNDSGLAVMLDNHHATVRRFVSDKVERIYEQVKDQSFDVLRAA